MRILDLNVTEVVGASLEMVFASLGFFGIATFLTFISESF